MIMKIEKFNQNNLRNEEHYQFQTEFKTLVDQSTPSALNIEIDYATYQTHYAEEGEALNVVRKSALSDDLTEADHHRNDILHGMFDAVKSAGNHFKPEMKAAATRLQVLFDHYSDITHRTHDSKTSAITSLIAELTTTYASEISIISLNEWSTELQSSNDGFVNIKANRYSEEASKTQFRMKEVRADVDTIYRTIIERINALITINGDAAHKNFVTELNLRIAKYNNIIAQRKGRNGKSDETPTTPPSAN